jgi:hypothetical protein
MLALEAPLKREGGLFADAPHTTGERPPSTLIAVPVM